MAHLLHSSDRLKDNFAERIPTLMSEVGLRQAREVSRRSMAFGLVPVAYYQASGQSPADRMAS